jgi:putative oxidoreductase
MTSFLQLVGRVLMSLIFVWAGWGKLMAMSATMAYIASGGVPAPAAAYWVAVFIEFVVGLALLLGLFTRVAGLVLAAWCVITALMFHADFSDHNMQIHFMKNIAMMGGLLYVAAFGGGAFSVDAMMGRGTEDARAVA